MDTDKGGCRGGRGAAKRMYLGTQVKRLVQQVRLLSHIGTKRLQWIALDIPFLLLPFRPSTETSAARTVVRNYFSPAPGREPQRGAALVRELKMTDAMVCTLAGDLVQN
jgi:Domain of unknown function (DUF1708)